MFGLTRQLYGCFPRTFTLSCFTELNSTCLKYTEIRIAVNNMLWLKDAYDI